MTHGTTIFIPKEVICPNCQLKDFDKKVIQEIRGTDTYACVRLKCTHCNYVCSSSPFRIIEPLNEEEEEEMINLSDYSCDKCAREFSRHCKHCLHTAEKSPTRFKPKKKTGIQTPEFRKPTPPPPPTSGSNAVKPNPNYVPPASVKKSCPYELPCGWCTKWDKKCDKKIGCEPPSIPMPESHARKIINEIKSGKLPQLDMNDTYGLEIRG